MYTFIREIGFRTMADGVKAVPIAASIAKYYKDNHDVSMRLMRPIGGAPGRLRFIFELASLDRFQAIQTKVATDTNFHKLLGELAPLIDGSRTNDEIWA